ncbi:MAG: STAS domain-containing protein [bacterium]
MLIDARDEGGISVVELVGRGDAEGVSDLRDCIGDLLCRASNIVLVMREVPYIGSSFVGLLIELHKTIGEKGGKISIAEPSSGVERILRDLGVHRILRMHASLEEALISFR